MPWRLGPRTQRHQNLASGLRSLCESTAHKILAVIEWWKVWCNVRNSKTPAYISVFLPSFLLISFLFPLQVLQKKKKTWLLYSYILRRPILHLLPSLPFISLTLILLLLLLLLLLLSLFLFLLFLPYILFHPRLCLNSGRHLSAHITSHRKKKPCQCSNQKYQK